MKNEKQNPRSRKKMVSLFVEVILVLWMAGIFLINLLLFTLPIVWSISEQLNMEKPLMGLHSSLQQPFLTTDFSDDSVISSPFWLYISMGK